jgi:hypothetical protein
VEKVIGALPEETAEEVQQEAIRIQKGSCKPMDNLTGVERKTLWAMKANVELTVLPADSGKMTMVLTAALLEDQGYRILKKNTPESVECKIILLLKKSSCSAKHLLGLHIM